ncbi:unnamed protein product, partial [Anisakis simplex]|uniref:Major capsid protein n=1 Tax=Anisakis simplex TaxID=6269 RepID=A0A0M3KJ48_ANISI
MIRHVGEHVTILEQPYILNWAKNIGAFCDEVLIRLASVTANGVSRFSEPYVIERPVPQLNSALSVESMTYLDVPYDDRSYQSNGTVKLVMRFERTEWPLGVSDLDVVPLFHMINCEVPDLSAA